VSSVFIALKMADRKMSSRAKRGDLTGLDEITTASFRSLVMTPWIRLPSLFSLPVLFLPSGAEVMPGSIFRPYGRASNRKTSGIQGSSHSEEKQFRFRPAAS
jgi:hypothetical protein